MVRPDRAAKPDTTSAISALSQVTVMRGSCRCCERGAVAGRSARDTVAEASVTGVDAAEASAAAETGSDRAAVGTPEDHARNDSSAPKLTRTWPSSRWTV
jgi:hypothetical protein